MLRRGIPSAAVAGAVLVGLFSCKQESAPPAPIGAPDSAGIAPAVPPVPPAAPSVEPAAPKPEPQSPAPAPAPEEGPVWLSISRGGVELGILELTPGRPGVLTLEKNDAAAKELKRLWDRIARAGSIAVDMHLPPKSGKGRGPYGSRVLKPGDNGYAFALRERLEEAEFYVEEVPALAGEVLVPELRQLNVVRNGKPVGSLDFATDPPTLSIKTTESDGSFLKGHWDAIATLEQLKVRFLQPRSGVEKLITLEAKRGEPNYPNVVRLYLILRHQYDEQHGYSLTTVP